MRLYILRHAIAEERRPNLAESKRPLTEKGKAELQRALLGMKQLKVEPDVVLSSPYARAWDTAVPAAEALLGKASVVSCDALKPEGEPAAIWAALKPYARHDAVMVVGHEPLLTEFAAFVLNSPRLAIKLKKSSLIRIDVEEPGGERSSAELKWLLTPGQLIAIGS